MDPRALELLELPAILDRLAAEAASEPGKDRSLALVPSAEPDEVDRLQSLTREAIDLFERSAEPDVADVRDVRRAAEVAARGSVLDTAALRSVATSIDAATAARDAIETAGGAPGLEELAAGVDHALVRVSEPIARAVEDDGSDLRDGASPALRRLRRELREGRGRITERLRALARDPSLREHLSEDFVTERAGRPVLALRASARGAVPGIVHDSSGSGQTLFVEPFAVVEDSNRLREAESAEREEVARILRELSRAVGDRADGIVSLVQAIGAIDLAFACARLSRRWRGTEVMRSRSVALRGARHPLLDPATAVPIDLEPGALRAVVISGPNTGGKTVALKTVGLAALLHQCGLRPPAEHVELPVFDQVLADIGDEQSIAMSLSTFSGHVRNLVTILESATDRSLVLLDELAAGTDPVEGAALAQSLLERLAGQARLTIATSHYHELKEWASASADASNAATGFDPETEEPLYRIALGRPGTSHALRIAARLGLPPEVIEDATRHIAPERRRVTELLAEAEAAEEQAAGERERAARERAATEEARRAAEARVEELEAEIGRVRCLRPRRAGARARRRGARARRDACRARRSPRRDPRRAPSRTRATSSVDAARRREGAGARPAPRGGVGARRARGALAPSGGRAARGNGAARRGRSGRRTLARRPRDDRRDRARRGRRGRAWRPARPRPARAAPPRSRGTDRDSDEPAVTLRTPTPTHAPSELDVRGRTAQESREAVRAFVDTAALAGRDELRVIHGRGTGAVRTAVRDELTRHPLVSSHESDSADGATVVRLR